MATSVADHGPAVLSSAICAQTLAVYDVLKRRLDCSDVDASFAPAVATTVERLVRRADAEPWRVTPRVAARADQLLDSALHAEASIAVASWFQTLPEAVLALLERRGSVMQGEPRAVGVPGPRRRATDR